MELQTTGILLTCLGLIFIIGSILNWGFVVGSGKLLPRLVGTPITKIIMIILGLGLVGFGILLLLGFVP